MNMILQQNIVHHDWHATLEALLLPLPLISIIEYLSSSERTVSIHNQLTVSILVKDSLYMTSNNKRYLGASLSPPVQFDTKLSFVIE